MRFWDTSALVPLLVHEATTAALAKLYRGEDAVIAWWGTAVECASAVARLERAGQLAARATSTALARLDALADTWHVIEPTDAVRQGARRLLRAHDLRAGDALQLAAAVIAAEGQPGSLEVVCLDERLAMAALREGFMVVDRARL